MARAWYARESDVIDLDGLPDGTQVGAQDTGRTFTYDRVRGLVPDLPDRSAGETLVIGSDDLPSFKETQIPDASQTSVTNSVVETTFFTQTIPGGRLGANGRLVVDVFTQHIQNTGAPNFHLFTLYAQPSGSSEVVVFNFGPAIQPSAVNGYGILGWEVVNFGSETAQYVTCRWRADEQTTGSALVDGIHATAALNTFDSSVDWVLRLTTENGLASLNYGVVIGPTHLETIYIP